MWDKFRVPQNRTFREHRHIHGWRSLFLDLFESVDIPIDRETLLVSHTERALVRTTHDPRLDSVNRNDLIIKYCVLLKIAYIFCVCSKMPL